MSIPFTPLTMAHKALVQHYTLASACRNCDLSFLNLVSWRFLYDTQLAEHRDHLLFRFKANGHNAYLAPLGQGPLAPVLTDLMADAAEAGEPFLMLGVSEPQLAQITEAMPSRFYAHADRAYTDYLYSHAGRQTAAGQAQLCQPLCPPLSRPQGVTPHRQLAARLPGARRAMDKAEGAGY